MNKSNCTALEYLLFSFLSVFCFCGCEGDIPYYPTKIYTESITGEATIDSSSNGINWSWHVECSLDLSTNERECFLYPYPKLLTSTSGYNSITYYYYDSLSVLPIQVKTSEDSTWKSIVSYLPLSRDSLSLFRSAVYRFNKAEAPNKIIVRGYYSGKKWISKDTVLNEAELSIPADSLNRFHFQMRDGRGNQASFFLDFSLYLDSVLSVDSNKISLHNVVLNADYEILQSSCFMADFQVGSLSKGSDDRPDYSIGYSLDLNSSAIKNCYDANFSGLTIINNVFANDFAVTSVSGNVGRVHWGGYAKLRAKLDISSKISPRTCGEWGGYLFCPEKTYETISVGNLRWMAENVAYTDSTALTSLKGNVLCYLDSSYYCKKYGPLYTWSAALAVCPEGWHLPSEADWNELADAFDGTALKSSSGWYSDANGTNTSGFDALPGGYCCYEGHYDDLFKYAYFWSSAENDSTTAYFRHLYYGDPDIHTKTNSKTLAFSVRCVKD